MTPTTDLGLSISLSMFELREIDDWDIFLGPPERAGAETGGADQWVVRWREFPWVTFVNEITPASMEYPLSVFNKNSTLKARTKELWITHHGEKHDFKGGCWRNSEGHQQATCLQDMTVRDTSWADMSTLFLSTVGTTCFSLGILSRGATVTRLSLISRGFTDSEERKKEKRGLKWPRSCLGLHSCHRLGRKEGKKKGSDVTNSDFLPEGN